MSTSASFPRLIIEQVTPELDCGRYPIKRPVGSVVEVGAAIFKDGHDQIAARIMCRPPGEKEFQSSPLTYRFDPDRWYGSFRVDRLGRWQYTIEAWPNHYGTWRGDLGKRIDAGQDVRSELVEGALLLERHAKRLKLSLIHI